MADGSIGEGDCAISPELQQAALDAAITHLVGDSRAWLLLVEGYLDEIASLRDERAASVVKALGLTLAEAADLGTLRHVERAATQLLRALTALDEVVRPPE